MAAGPQAFYCLWQDGRIRETLFELLTKEDICNVRISSSACCNLVTKRLFLRTHLTFSANTFTRQSRVEALSRIGHHIEHLTFYFPHSDATFLPPLIHPETGQEISFLYKPHTSIASVLERPKFANSGLGEILTAQYPPLFHAATNVPSFIHAMKRLPNMRHLTIKTPGQNAKERYRRDIVDYALISLRISLERTPMKKLMKLSLSSVHPSAFIYLRHVTGFGCLPSAGKRWKQIRKLHISVESWDFYGPSPGRDHLKMIDDYIRNFSDNLEKLTFTWLGRKGPCPLSLAADPLFAPPRSSQKLFNEVTSPMSPLPPAPARKPVVFQKLRFMAVRNATMNAAQVSDLVASHSHCVREFDFENVVLINGGSWDDALAPLMDNSANSDHWSRHSTATIYEENASLPDEQETADDVSAPSAAVTAASKELYDHDLNFDNEDAPEEPQSPPESDDIVVNLDLDSDIEAAREASMTFSKQFKKRRITKHRRKRKPSHEQRDHDRDRSQNHEQRHRRQRSEDSLEHTPHDEAHHQRRHRHQKSKDSIGEQRRQQQQQQPQYEEVQAQPHNHSRQPSNESLASARSQRPTEPPRLTIPQQPSRAPLFGEVESVCSLRTSSSSSSSQRLFGEITPSLSPANSAPDLSHSPTWSPTDSLVGDYFRPVTPPPPSSPFNATAIPPSPGGSSTLSTLTPATFAASPTSIYTHTHTHTYSKTPTKLPRISSPILNTQPPMPSTTTTSSSIHLLQPRVYDPTAELCSEISAVQRDLAAEEAQRLVGLDPEVQVSALRRAKELVLSRLGSQFGGSVGLATSPTRKDGSGGSGGEGVSSGGGSGFLGSARFREGLFGRGMGGGGGGVVVLERGPRMGTGVSVSSQGLDHRSMDVPILFSRA
ncbi:hypothetical protein F4778DRAFT_601423 [Xylariomycetidae sp. FL2044]|nr:hypothetical protein F4778DRAFT_601423 [Xylariomycetidae sp. FL2044]